MSRREKPSGPPDRLLDELSKVESRLQQWISSSEENAERFRRNPLEAMRAAGLDVEDNIMLELELIMKAIARKLKK